MSTEHEDVRELLAAWAVGALPPAEARTVPQHLAECPACAAEAHRLHETVRLLDGPPQGTPPDRTHAGHTTADPAAPAGRPPQGTPSDWPRAGHTTGRAAPADSGPRTADTGAPGDRPPHGLPPDRPHVGRTTGRAAPADPGARTADTGAPGDRPPHGLPPDRPHVGHTTGRAAPADSGARTADTGAPGDRPPQGTPPERPRAGRATGRDVPADSGARTADHTAPGERPPHSAPHHGTPSDRPPAAHTTGRDAPADPGAYTADHVGPADRPPHGPPPDRSPAAHTADHAAPADRPPQQPPAAPAPVHEPSVAHGSPGARLPEREQAAASAPGHEQAVVHEAGVTRTPGHESSAGVREGGGAAVSGDVLSAILRSRAPVPRVARHAAPYAAAVTGLHALLRELDDDHARWGTPVVHDWDVHSTVAHLIAADEPLARRLGLDPRLPPPPATESAHWQDAWAARTAAVIAHERTRPPEETVTAWDAQAQGLLAAPEARDPERAACATTLMGMRLPLADHFLVRAFETWIHTADIGRALGRTVPPPPDAHLWQLVRLAVRILGAALGPEAPPVLFAVVGGDHDAQWVLGSEDDPVRAELALEPVDFCLLVGGRYDPGDVPRGATGDESAVRNVLERAARLAWL
ncbi:maleylpyruvate isomerase family mycothiol-dependent enzyme [Streptomyces sp. NPDC059786]|uniref:maleylpyruvate isomerase family mycothiol-dependent enzyme n=1 Tax=Streptomyces sp. NPDC059786 TaxID=3346946 RepID=UPI0036489F0A